MRPKAVEAAGSDWDAYAPFYDWENARTIGRRDLHFWKEFVRGRGRTLELGCGTGRLLIPLARTGARMIGVDYSAAMLSQARRRLKRLPAQRRPRLVRGDIRALPCSAGSVDRVFAPYGVLQSLTTDADFDAALHEAARVLTRRGRLGIELVPELASWAAYQRQVRFRGRLGNAHVTLVESVRQDRQRGLTIFDEEFTLRSGNDTNHRHFSLTFRNLKMDDVVSRLGRSGFVVDDLQGDYRGKPWTPDADVWIILARRSATAPRP